MPRAKSRALGKDTLCRGPATGALGKERLSTKTGLRQIKSLPALGKLGPLGHDGHFPSSFAEGHPLGPRQRFFFPVQPGYSAIFFKSLPRALDQALGKDFFKTSFSAKFFFINRLCRGPEARPSAKKPFAEGQDRPSAKIFCRGPWGRPSAIFFLVF